MTALVFPALLMGILGSAHCALMCGPVAGSLCTRPKASLAFNAGRLLTYVGLGTAAGAFGAMAPIFAVALRPLAAVALVLFGLHLAGVSTLFSKIEKVGLPLWKTIAPLTTKALPTTILGALWGFVPCGLVYAALTLAASSGGAFSGALVLLAFGAGTLPAMVAVSRVARAVLRFRRAAGILTLALGLHQTVLAFAAFDPSLTGRPPPCHAHSL